MSLFEVLNSFALVQFVGLCTVVSNNFSFYLNYDLLIFFSDTAVEHVVGDQGRRSRGRGRRRTTATPLPTRTAAQPRACTTASGGKRVYLQEPQMCRLHGEVQPSETAAPRIRRCQLAETLQNCLQMFHLRSFLVRWFFQ